jgi:hypothetical protein
VPVTAEELLASLASRRAAVTSVRGRARVKNGVAGLWTREAIVVRRPSDVRIDVLSPFGLTLAVGTDGSVLWVYPPAEGARYEGPATPENIVRLLGAPVTVADLVDVLLGLPPARPPTGPVGMEVAAEGQYVLTLPFEDGVQHLWFAGDTHDLVRAEETRAGAVLEVGFGDYRDGFPHLLKVTAGNGGAATLAYESVEPNATVDPALFAPPQAARVLPLASARASQ